MNKGFGLKLFGWSSGFNTILAMASGYDYILIYKPASADELIRAIEVAKSLQMAFWPGGLNFPSEAFTLWSPSGPRLSTDPAPRSRIVTDSLTDGFSKFHRATRVLSSQRRIQVDKAEVSRTPSKPVRVGNEVAVFSGIPGMLRV
ncbi:hypothetical protein ACJA88_010842 [Fusarium oxysporum]